MSKRSEQVAAYHEAGHAVMHCVLDLKFTHVSIEPNEDSHGRVVAMVHPAVTKLIADGDYSHAAVRHHYERYLIAVAAGPFAQRKRFPRSRINDAAKGLLLKGSDRQIIADKIFDLFGTDEVVRHTYERYIDARSRALVGHYWSEIEQLAEALLVREPKIMTEEEVFELLRPPGPMLTATSTAA